MSSSTNVDGYVALLRAIFHDRETGRWRYRYLPCKRSKQHALLVVRVCCERYIWADRDWRQMETWRDLYRETPGGELGYQGRWYRLVRSIDPWHESTRETTLWPASIQRARRKDTRLLELMAMIRATVDTPRIEMRG